MIGRNLTARNLWQLFVVVGLLTLAVAMQATPDDPGPAMTAAAEKFLATLPAEQRATATMSFDDPARLKWHFIPMPERKGLQFKHMTPPQREAALALLRSALSPLGYGKATEIMALEGILRELEKTRSNGPIRDPERYYFTLFGAPSNTGRWGLSVEGHHLSLNFVVEQGKLRGHTPAFFGANPAVVRNALENLPKAGTRTLAGEEQQAFALLASLTADERKTATIADKAPADIRGPADPQPPTGEPAGIALGKLNASQQKLAWSLIEAYAANMAPAVAQARLHEIQAAGVDKIFFAWAGAGEPGVGHYYRLEGPTFLVEFVNVQPDAAGNPANHIHSVWRDRRGDFGVAR